MLKLSNISYHYRNGSNGAGVDGITLDLLPGEFILLVGCTGAGKTTLIRLISLELFPASGEIILERLRAGALPRRRLPMWRRRLGIVFQDIRLLPDRTLLDNVRLAASCEHALPGRPKSRALRALAQVGLAHKLHSLPDWLSAGELQRAALARALVNEPTLLLADEPLSNLDHDAAAALVDLLKKVNQAGTAMLVATHQPERFVCCNPRLIRLDRGRLVET